MILCGFWTTKSGERGRNCQSREIFIYNSFACRKGKGTHKAVQKLREGIRKISKNYKIDTYYAQLDIAGFFMSINQDILYSIFKKLILKQNKSIKWKEKLLWLGEIIIEL